MSPEHCRHCAVNCCRNTITAENKDRQLTLARSCRALDFARLQEVSADKANEYAAVTKARYEMPQNQCQCQSGTHGHEPVQKRRDSRGGSDVRLLSREGSRRLNRNASPTGK